jgi:hypothetical protein
MTATVLHTCAESTATCMDFEELEEGESYV